MHGEHLTMQLVLIRFLLPLPVNLSVLIPQANPLICLYKLGLALLDAAGKTQKIVLEVFDTAVYLYLDVLNGHANFASFLFILNSLLCLFQQVHCDTFHINARMPRSLSVFFGISGCFELIQPCEVNFDRKSLFQLLVDVKYVFENTPIPLISEHRVLDLPKLLLT